MYKVLELIINQELHNTGVLTYFKMTEDDWKYSYFVSVILFANRRNLIKTLTLNPC